MANIKVAGVNIDHLLVPTEFSICTIYIGCAEKSLQFGNSLGYEINKEINITLGLGTTNYTRTIDSNLQKMRKGDSTSAVFLKDNVSHTLNVSLVNFVLAPRVYELKLEDILERAKILKKAGTIAFEKNDIETAFYLYSRSIKYLICALVDIKTNGCNNEIIKKDLLHLRCLCHLNLAACQLLGTNSRGVVKNCTEALLIEPNNVKALFRRSQAHIKHKEYDKAVDDLTKALESDPSNKVLINALHRAKKECQQENLALANNLKGIFG